MKYEVISGCVIAGKIYQTGSITEMSVDAAKILVSMGRIIPHKDGKQINGLRSIF